MPSVRPDPKPPRRFNAGRRGRKQLHAQIVRGKSCRICGERADTMHHLVPRSLGGDDVAENLVPLCGDGTRGCHGAIEARRPGFRSRLRIALTGAERDYVIRRMGAGFLDRHYPLPDVEAA